MLHRRPLPVALYTHPFEIALGLVLLLLGVTGFFGTPSPAVASLPMLQLAIYNAVSAVGGAGLLFGIFRHDPPRQIGIGVALERASLYLVASAYAGRGVLVVAHNGYAGASTGILTAILATACLFRAAAIRRTSKAVVAAHEQVKRERNQ